MERHTKARIAKWNAVKDLALRSRTLARVEMWRALPAPLDAPVVPDPVKRCKSLAAEGRYALACRALADVESVAPFSPETFDILVSKHPRSEAAEYSFCVDLFGCSQACDCFLSRWFWCWTFASES